MAEHQELWDAALETEHGHQRELLATLRGELAEFARECASALTALDAFVGLTGVAAIASQAQQGYAHAKLLHDIVRRRSGESEEGHSARELLGRVASDSSVRAELESLWGAAPVAILQALQPLRKWIPTVASVRRGEKGLREVAGQAGSDLVGVLTATESVAGDAAEAIAADVGSLAQSLRDTVQHVETAARSVAEGKLEDVLAESRRLLESDLAALAGVITGAVGAEEVWLHDRRDEHGALTTEVKEKLERVERTRRVLGLFLPHLQAIARSLATAEKAMSLEQRLFPQHVAAVEASRQLMLVDLGSLWEAGVPFEAPRHGPRHRPRHNGKLALAGGAVVVAAAVAIPLAVSNSKHAPTTPVAATTTAPATTAAAASAWTCSGNQVTVFDNTNGGGVTNGGKPASFSTHGKAYCLTYVYHYHWNNGVGPTPGKVGLTQTAGPAGLPRTISLPALGSTGSNNAKNVNWYADVTQTPPTVIDGSYVCTDSSPSTWSADPATGGAGFCQVKGVPATHS